MPEPESRRDISVLFVDDEEGLRRIMTNQLGRMGFAADSAADVQTARRSMAEKDYDVVLLDLRMPGIRGDAWLEELRATAPTTEVIILTGHGDLDTAVACMKRGAFDFVTKPCPLDRLEILIDRAHEKRKMSARVESLDRAISTGAEATGCPVAADLEERVNLLAPTREPVLILGESGTGKELLAHEIWRRSTRASAPIIPVNCSALSETVLEAELFGHEKGAFTGADSRRMGVFELADKGTIFLDEIGDMPLLMQAKLLRTLQSGEVRPVGAQQTRRVDVRIISATNQDLPRMVEDGRFRSDLFYRINTFTLALKPLRKRMDEVEYLAASILADYTRRLGRSLAFSPETMRIFLSHPWPGNIRELENVIRHAAIVTRHDEIQPADLPDYLCAADAARLEPDLRRFSAAEIERMHLTQMIEACGGNKREAARRLGIASKTLYNKLHAHGIELEPAADGARGDGTDTAEDPGV